MAGYHRALQSSITAPAPTRIIILLFLLLAAAVCRIRASIRACPPVDQLLALCRALQAYAAAAAPLAVRPSARLHLQAGWGRH